MNTGKVKNSLSSLIALSALWLFFALFVLIPVFFVFSSITAESIGEVFTSQRFLGAMKNTVIECIFSTVFSVAAGYIYAYAVIRGNLPFKKFFSVIPLIHMVTPPFVGGLSFILLFGRQGFVTKTLLGLDVSLYGFWGLLLSQVLCFFPIAYLISCQTLAGINPSIEQAARSMGAGRFKIFSTVTLPLSISGITSALLFIAVSVLSDFGNPLIVGGRFRVLSVEIYTQLTGWLNTSTAAVLGLILLIPSALLFICQNKLLKKNVHKFATIGGKTASSTYVNVSRPVNALLTVFCSILSLLILAQLASIIAGSFQKLWGINTSFTLNHFRAIFAYKAHLINSVVFALVSAVLSTFIAAVTAFFTHRTTLPALTELDAVCQIPSAIPGTMYGLSLAYFANAIHFNCSPFLIVMAMTVSYLPFSYRICSSVFSQIKTTLDDAGRSLGAGKFKVLHSIILPLCTGGLFSSFVYDFVRGVGTLSSVIFLVSFNTSLASVKILNLAEQGDWGKSAALALVLTIITFIILGAGKFLSRHFETKIWNSN